MRSTENQPIETIALIGDPPRPTVPREHRTESFHTVNQKYYLCPTGLNYGEQAGTRGFLWARRSPQSSKTRSSFRHKMQITFLEAKSEAITHNEGVPNNFNRIMMIAIATNANACSKW